MAATLAAIPGQGAASGTPGSNADSDGTTIQEADGVRYHLMTEQEMFSMREKIGVRQEGVNYNEIVEGFGTGLAPPTEEEWQAMVGTVGIAEDAVPDALALPAAYDLSSQSYFPAVRSQGSQGSCGAWASIYYAYGYLEAKDNGWTDAKSGTNNAHLMSPAWAYNKVNGGADSGSWMSQNFEVAIDWGIATWATHPYNQADPVGWGGPEAFREAPLHRASSYVFHDLTGDAAVNQVKQMISEDRPITFAMNAGYYTFDNGQYIVTSLEYAEGSSLNHAQTVVGYDDTISEDGDVGAFRIVNSWGSGWGNGGYYWLTYAAFKEICTHPYQGLTEVIDRADYVPSMLATLHFNDAPIRGSLTMNLGTYPSSSKQVSPYFAYDSNHDLPSFLCLDISNFRSDFDSGSSNFWVDLPSGTGVLSSLKVESYEGGYVPGAPTQASAQSTGVPSSVPGHASITFAKYSIISSTAALDHPGVSISSSGQARWTAVPHTSYAGGASMQSGDVGDSSYSSMQATVSSASGVSFYWKVSSESGKDYLRFYVDGVQQDTTSGILDWTKKSFSLSSGAHVLKWNYTRDISNCGNTDTAWVDKVVIIPLDDSFEENDDSSNAYSLSPTGTYDGLIGLDADWYRFTVDQDDRLTVQLDLNSSLGDLDLYLYGPDGTTLIDSSSTSGASEVVDFFAPSSNGYFLKVQPDAGQFSRYSLTFSYESGALDYGRNSSLSIKSGTGGFSSIASDKSLMVQVGDTISGTILLNANVSWSSSDQIPLIGTTSWGLPSTSFFEAVSDLASGTSEVEVGISFTGPDTPGTYYLIFAFRNESSAGHIASASDDVLGTPVWGDGNDIALFSSAQIDESRSSGRTLGNWLRIDGMHSIRIPSDALLIDVIPVDVSPPSTSSSLSGTSGSNGWYRSSVTITLTAIDSGSGVASTFYRVNGGSYDEYLAPFAISSQGTFTIDYYSVDNVGNAESARSVNVRIDLTAPITTLSLTGASGGYGWFLNNVGLNFSVSESLSGFQSTYYRLDGGTWMRFLPGATISAEGQHQMDYYSIDSAGNSESVKHTTVSIDRSAPQSSADLEGMEGTNGWYLGTVRVSIVAQDPMSGLSAQSFCLDGGAWQTYESPFYVSAQGYHELIFNSIDLAGNVETAKTITFNIDVEAPTSDETINGTMGLDGWYVSSAVVELGGSDALSGLYTIQYSLDGGPWTDYTSMLTISDTGEHTLLYRATDIAGNVQEAVNLIIRVDTSPPTAVLDQEGSIGDGGWFLSNVELGANGSDEGSGIASYQVRVDGSEWTLLMTRISILQEGEHLVEVYARDVAGNIGPTATSLVNIDLVAPESTANVRGSEGEEDWFVSSVEVEIEASDPVSGASTIYYRINEGAWITYGGEFTIDSEGVFLISYYSRDKAGNVEGLSSADVKIELGPPTTSLSLDGTMGQGGWYVSMLQGNLSATDSLSGVAGTFYRIDDSEWIESATSLEIGHGKHVLDYYSIDRAGNHEYVRSMDVWVDTRAPSTGNQTEGHAGTNHWFVSQVIVSFHPVDEGSGLARTLYQVDGGPWEDYTSPFTISDEGVHTLIFHSIDIAGNHEPSAFLILMVDLTPPMSSASLQGEQGSNGWYVTAVNLTLSAHDGMSGIYATEWRLDEGEWSPYIDKETVATTGHHTVEFRSWDHAGNIEGTRNDLFDIDLEKPSFKLNHTGKPFTSEDVVLLFDVQDSGSTVSRIEVKVDGTQAITLSQVPWQLELSGLSDGYHELEVTVYDMAGNSLEETEQIKVDTNPLSPEGPYGPWLLMSIIALVVVAIVLVAIFWKRKI
ncbi:MAG: pre-peptidase C-terminal domain-containing protein [Methanomassiliicoccales archaeon]|nr:pre-peptidase C-terminal domain-containing protein [Methanomassiliicoccales archaeon]